MKINQLKCGESATIQGFDGGASAYRQQLLAMGLTPGTSFRLTKIAPLGDPIEIHVRDYDLTLRKHEAAILNLEKHDANHDADLSR
ncbi:MAG: iron transporter FeoA [marine bacterium B5-7]|nr:MAG: iron transporter FeoA [marine bacterium B5-7]